jgi:hypothetical protein
VGIKIIAAEFAKARHDSVDTVQQPQRCPSVTSREHSTVSWAPRGMVDSRFLMKRPTYLAKVVAESDHLWLPYLEARPTNVAAASLTT